MSMADPSSRGLIAPPSQLGIPRPLADAYDKSSPDLAERVHVSAERSASERREDRDMERQQKLG
jgi:hypothetical protein